MRYEGNTPQYSAFAIVAIESVWPNPEGSELSPDTTDLTILGQDSENYKSQIRDGFRPNGDGVETEEDYSKNQGYYKILPLNVVNLQTQTSLGGSSFSVTFTLDDLLLVLPEGSENLFRFATGLPISNNDLIESSSERGLPQLISPDGSDGANWEYVKDSDLGLSRYRITGPYSSFNVEDLVDVNDTVTIWIYHDPTDFYLKDGMPITSGDVLLPNDNITGVVGSADRQNQFSAATNNFDETFLFQIGLVNDIVSEAVTLTEEDGVDQIAPVDRDNIVDIILVMSQEASSGILPDNAYQKIKDYVDETFPPSEGGIGDIEREYISDILAITRRIDPVTERPTGPLSDIGVMSQDRVNKLNNVINRLPMNASGDFVNPDESGGEVSLSSSFVESSRVDLADLGFVDLDKFIVSLNLFKNSINDKSRRYAENYLSRRSSVTANQVFSNGRRVLLNDSHGETPYLALKGVISSISTNIGTTEGAYTVTLSGVGYEKVLTTNEIFYEDLLYPEARYAPLTDYNTVYMNMSPPRAIHQIISRWAARQVVFGQPTTYSLLALNRNFNLRPPLGVEETEEEEESVVKYEGGFPGASGQYPIRGTFVYSDYVGEGQQDPSVLRVFAPVNYLDTTRIREMATTLDKSYRDPSTEAAINTAQSLAGRESIMQNLRKIGGAAQFYEMFVDESGRFRYRVRFEALERTPNPLYTPILQDFDILSSGNSFSMDDSELATIVDVSPILTASVTAFGSLAFIGRSVPKAGTLPIDNVAPIPEESLSPDLHRYGMRTLKVQDLYQSERGGARRKAHLYRMFYGNPLKKATLRLRNNTSFRAGETVLVSLQKYKKRARTLIDLRRMRDWMNFLLRGENKDLLEMYIGIEPRFLPDNKDSYSFTRGADFIPIPQEQIYQKYSENPHRFVAEAFRDTFQHLISVMPEINVITPEYFPPTYWYFQRQSGTFENWDRGNIRDSQIISLLSYMMRASAIGDEASKREISNILSVTENQGIINAAKFHNFKATSYYIEGVSHKFTYGAEATTSLSLNFGQDSLVLLEPKSFLPIGFISLEKKMRIGYDDGENGYQPELWQEPFTDKSALQNMYINQFIEDKKYKQASFLHRSQANRNSSNYMYEIVNIIDPINTSAMDYNPDIVPEPTISPEIVDTGNPYVDQERRETRIIEDSGASRTVSLKDDTVTIEYSDGRTEVITPISAEERSKAQSYLDYQNYKEDLIIFIAGDSEDTNSSYLASDEENIRKLLTIYEESIERHGGNPSQEDVDQFLVDFATEHEATGGTDFSENAIHHMIRLVTGG